MLPAVCPESSLTDLTDECTRAALTTAVPAGVAFLLLVARLTPKIVKSRVLSWTPRPFLVLDEAEALLYPENATPTSQPTASRWSLQSIALATISWLELVAWSVVAILHRDSFAAVVAATWLYAALVATLAPSRTAPYGLFALWLAFLVASVVDFGGLLYNRFALGEADYPTHEALYAKVANFVALVVAAGATASMPLATPSPKVLEQLAGEKFSLVSPQDYASLWSWLTFAWVTPIIANGTYNTLNPNDVWDMSPTLAARPTFRKFSSILPGQSFLRRLVSAHAYDMLRHFALVYASVGFQYLQPFFLNRLLASINGISTPAARSQALVYALLMFAASITKTETDLQYLYLCRKTSAHLRCEIMSGIYEKSLRRKDYSGVTKKDASEEKKEGEGEGEKKEAESADIGRIVNLMSNDAQRVSDFVIGIFMLISAPVEIILCCVFLYYVLGWSAFAGFATFIVILPINHWLTKRSIRISEGNLAATDKRMSVLNELITEVKFIKFFAWEQKWIERALEARKVELSWIVKDRINNSFFGLMWMTVPSIVSVTSFTVYIYTGHSLTVPVAFTAVALFNMLQNPLNLIPHFVASLLRIGVSVRRIESFLKEEDVPDDISALKRAAPTATNSSDVLGIERASFVWNKPVSPDDKKEKPKAKKRWLRLSFWAKEPAEVPAPVKEEEEEDTPFELRDIDVVFPSGKLTLVTGPTASGKSSLLHALLGEMTQSSATGRVLIPKNTTQVDPDTGLKNCVSYAAQTPWLQHNTIRDNILFGSPFEEDRYWAVVEACALKPDLAILDDGDQTEIGVRGVSLSGGQKARVALARAVYQRTKHVILDDPLSAVDSHTARVLLDRLFRGALLKDRTIVLVTHHVELMLPAAAYVVRMLDGRIDSSGTVAELRTRGVLDEIKHDAAEVKEEPAKSEEETREEQKKDTNKPRVLVEDEARAEGRVKWSVYDTYLKASSYWTWAGIILFIIIHQGFRVGQLLWIRIWGSESTIPVDAPASLAHSSAFVIQEATHMTLRPGDALHAYALYGNASTSTRPSADENPMFYVAIYAGITLATALSGLIMNIIEYVGAYRASRILFRRLLVSVVRAPFRWFDVTPTGRILNRFSRDVEVLDQSLSSSLGTFLAEFAWFLAGVVTISYVLPLFLIPAVAIAYLYYRLAYGYLEAGRDLRRMEAVAKSPVFQSFSELLEGIVTVRAFSAEGRFLDGVYTKIDTMNKMWWAFWMTNRWLLFRFDVIGAFAVLATSLLGLASMGSEGNFAGWAGLTITSAMSLTMSIYWTCRFITQLELDLNSVERVIEYLDLAQEPPAIIESNRPPAYWPSSSGGAEKPLLAVENLTIKYAPDLPPVLHGVSFSLQARERVGLLGRTGSGKSTIAMSLLRFVEPAEGKILIDGIDISTIGLQDLRSNVTFIPQDAALFSGTIRDNLDPFGEYSDEDCADALIRVHLVSTRESAFASAKPSRAPSIASAHQNGDQTPPSPDNASTVTDATTRVDDARQSVSLATKVSAGGTNFSQGQRQLVALARALLRRAPVIIMDEATSSIDFDTDAKIQATIREEFGNSLLLTVAHRLKTVADYDRLIVLDQGNIVEFDTPLNLIRKQDGHFRNMALKSGTFSELEAIALAAANNKPSST